MRPLFVIGVIGGGAPTPEAEEDARLVGRAIGAASCHLICGGRQGVMAAACEGHHQGRRTAKQPGITIGVLPGSNRDEANPWVDLPLPTGIGLARNALVVNGAQAVVAVDGGSGTLSEMAFAWQMGRPLVALEHSGGWAGRLAGETLDDKRRDSIVAAPSPGEAVEAALRLLRRET